jgi:hypothetical protein
MNQSFHNTIKLEGRPLAKAEGKAIKLEHQILAFLKNKPNQKFTPWEINDVFPDKLIGSIRRALTNLVRDIEEVKDTTGTKEMREERAGSPNYLWYYEVLVTTDEDGQIRLL